MLIYTEIDAHEPFRLIRNAEIVEHIEHIAFLII